MNRSRWCGVGVVALLLVAGLVALAEPCTITVQPGESIQAAIDAASPGDVICLAEGEWEENLVIDKDLSIYGAGAEDTSIRGLDGDFPVITVNEANGPEILVTINGITVTEGKWRDGYGIAILGNTQAVLVDCNVTENFLINIVLIENVQATIINCTIAGSGHGIYVIHNDINTCA